MTTPAQPTQAEKASTIYDWTVAGMARSKIPRYAALEGWIDTPEQLADLIAQAENDIIADACHEVPGPVTLSQAVAVAQLRLLMADSIRNGDPATALSARKELTKLASITGPTPPPRPALGRDKAGLLHLLRELAPTRSDKTVIEVRPRE